MSKRRNMIAQPSLQTRKITAFLLLSAAVIAGGYIATLGDETGVRDDALPPLLEFIAELELAHIAAHIFVFGGAALLLGDHPALAWRYVWTGALIMEAVQIAVGTHESLFDPLPNTVFDLLVDGVSAWVALRYGVKWA